MKFIPQIIEYLLIMSHVDVVSKCSQFLQIRLRYQRFKNKIEENKLSFSHDEISKKWYIYVWIIKISMLLI